MANTYPRQPPLNHRFMTVDMADISTAGSAWFVPGFRGKIKRIHSVIDGAIATADAAITVEIGGTAVSGAALTIANASSAAGDVDSVDVAVGSTNRFTETDAIEVITDGSSTNTVKAVFTFELESV